MPNERIIHKITVPSGNELFNVNTRLGINLYPSIEQYRGNRSYPVRPVSMSMITKKHEPTELLNQWTPKTYRKNITYTDDRIARDTRSEYRNNMTQ